MTSEIRSRNIKFAKRPARFCLSPSDNGRDEREGFGRRGVLKLTLTLLLSLARERRPIAAPTLVLRAIRNATLWPRSLLRTLALDN